MKKISNKKIIIETLIIPLCVLYLCFNLLHNHPKLCLIICSITILTTSLSLTIKYFREVYIFEHKYNYLKVIFGIFNTILLTATGLNIILNNNILNIIFIVLTSILLGFLITYATYNIINISKNKKPLYKSAYPAFFSLISFSIIIITLIYS